jgi:predicted CXXCH cytochrome family protein
MKKILVFAAILLLAQVGVGNAGPLLNTKHDLHTGSTAAITATSPVVNDTCVFCHTTHSGTPGGAAPLWNHTLTTSTLTWAPATTVRGTTLPTNLTLPALEGSRACMSCHDGTVALGSVLVYYNGTASGPATFTVTGTNTTAGKLASTSKAYMDPTHMEKNHPLGVPLPAAKAGFSSYVASDGGTGVWYVTSSNNLQYVQCQSCHDPHNTAVMPFLRISNVGGAICSSCHNM